MSTLFIRPAMRLCALSSLTGLAAMSAADSQTEALLAQMRNAYKSTKSASFTAESTFKTAQGSVKYTGSFRYKAPNRIKVALSSSSQKGTLTKVTDGKRIAMSGTGFKAPVQAYTIDNFERGLPANLESLSFWDWDRQLSTARGHNMATSTLAIKNGESWNGKKWIVLEETAAVQKLFVRYYVDPQSYLIWRTHVFTTGKKEVSDAVVTRMAINVPINDGEFKVSGGVSV